ncbi:MAG: adenylate cyclase [Methylobacteriaceae bacterium]|jgi:class 3 adenylate cyclase/TolB-like protein/Flp pilus assembly protein TadD|nr:adenylate cyclase [Methylobacteriaceae bacterium]
MTLLAADDHEPLPGAVSVDDSLVDLSSRRSPSRLNNVAKPAGVVSAHVERRLAAILIADIAGYSRLVGADEHGTLLQWHAHWDELIAPTIASHSGRIVRVTGDGILAEFASIVNAMRCALSIQRSMAARNVGIPADRRIEFRMGLNFGDLIVDRGDMWGEGVNVAARLEALATPGGICVSERVRNDVRGKLDVVFDELGEQHLKNISHPVRVFRARICAGESGAVVAARMPAGVAVALVRSRRRILFYSGLAIAFASCVSLGSGWLAHWRAPTPSHAAVTSSASTESTAARAQASLLSIAVLPFVNVSGDASQDYVADGITDSLTGDLSRALPGSFVLSRGTASSYRGRAADARQIGRELAARYLLAGSILAEGKKMRVNTQLVETVSGNQVWSERFDAERVSVLQLEDEIVTRLSRAIALKVIDFEAERSTREDIAGTNAGDLVMRGTAALNRPSSQQSMIQARTLFNDALAIEPNNADALAGLATTLVFEFVNGYYESGGEERLRKAADFLERALTLAPHHLTGLKASAALARAQGRFEDAIAVANGVLSENPGEPWAYKELGLADMYLGRLDEALDWFAKAERIGPRDPARWTWLDGRGQALILLGRDEEAVRSLILASEANPRSAGTQALLAAAYALVGRMEAAEAALSAYLAKHPDARASTFRQFAPVPLAKTARDYQAKREHLLEGLRKAGMPA